MAFTFEEPAIHGVTEMAAEVNATRQSVAVTLLFWNERRERQEMAIYFPADCGPKARAMADAINAAMGLVIEECA